MNGRLGRPYRFFYSAKNFVAGLSDIVAQVKDPDGNLHSSHVLTEFTGGLFGGTYYFEILTTQNGLSGEYTVAIYETTSTFRTIQKVTLDNTSSETSVEADPELYGKIFSDKVVGIITQDKILYGKALSDSLVGKVVDSGLSAVIQSDNFVGKLSEEILIGKLSEC